MKMEGSIKKTVAIVVALSILFSLPVLAAVSQNKENNILNFEDIKKLVSEENLQLKLSKASINRLNNDIDDAEDSAEEAQNSLYGLVYSVNGVIRSLDDIINKFLADPLAVNADVAAIAQATKLSLAFTQNTLYSQIESMDDSTDGMEDQLDLSKISYEQAENTLINTAQNLFVLYHQLTNNLDQLKITSEQLSTQLDLMNKNIELGLATDLAALDLKTSILELDASKTALKHQQDALLLQIKGLVGLSYKDALTLGEIPAADRGFIDTIDFGKDLEEALLNAMSKKIKVAELNNSKTYGSRRTYELQINENNIALSFTEKYYKLIETRDNLLISESKLKVAELKQNSGKINLDKGTISHTEFKNLEDEVNTLKLKISSNAMLLFGEIANYQAMKSGML